MLLWITNLQISEYGVPTECSRDKISCHGRVCESYRSDPPRAQLIALPVSQIKPIKVNAMTAMP